MSTLTLQMPDEQMKELERIARGRGLSVQSLLTELIGTLAPIAVENGASGGYDVTQDALFKIGAAGESGLGNLATEHDHYLYGTPKQG